MEKESDLVKIGKLIHDSYFKQDQKEVKLGPVAFDVVRKNNQIEIREVKKSEVFEKAHRYQILYYLYYLGEYGIKAKGVITFPKSRKVVEVELTEESKSEIEKTLFEIDQLISRDMPEPDYKKHCRKCAYFEFCFA
jgi:CRISPR-associated exonuclease Cas4